MLKFFHKVLMRHFPIINSMEEKYLLSRGASDTPTRMVCSGYHTFRRTGMCSSLAKISTNCLTSKFSLTILQVGHKIRLWCGRLPQFH